MQGDQCQSASQEEWSTLLDAIALARKDIRAHEDYLASGEREAALRADFDLTESAPQFKFLDDANECIQRLWSLCAKLSDTQQLIRDRVEKSSSNSSRPPSTDNISAKVQRYRANHKNHTPSGKKQGAQIGHKGYGRSLQSSVDEVVVCPAPDCCSHCSGRLSNHKIGRRKQVFYLEKKQLTTKEFQIMRARCQACGAVNQGELPLGTPKGSFGSCVLSVIAMLTGRYRLSKRQVKSCLYDLFGLKISVGSISNAEKEVSSSLERVTQEAHEALKVRGLVHADETTHYHKHQLRWMWALASHDLAYMSIHSHRNGEIARTLLGKGHEGAYVTDRHGAYNYLHKRCHQYCWSHLKRDIQAIIDSQEKGHQSFGLRLEAIRQAIFEEYRKNKITSRVLSPHMRKYLREFWDALQSGSYLPGKKVGHFCRHLTKNWRKTWNFLVYEEVPPTNNHAERMIRHNVLWRKLSLGTQSNRGDRYVERISTVHLSCHLQKRDLLSFLAEALKRHWMGQDPPSLLV